MKIFLVLHHIGARFSLSSPGMEVRHAFGEGSVGSHHGHDACCHCLLVNRRAYKTRAEADQQAQDAMVRYPDDYCWSVEVESPE